MDKQMHKQVNSQLLRVIRAVNDMRQPQLSKAVGVSISLLEKIEAGRRNITEHTAQKIINAFNLDSEKMNDVRKAIEILQK